MGSDPHEHVTHSVYRLPMRQTPDFEQIAHRILDDAYTDDGTTGDARTDARKAALQAAIAEQLRFVWNARGAADLAKVETELTAMMGATAAEPFIKNLDRALRQLDRWRQHARRSRPAASHRDLLRGASLASLGS